MDFYAILDPHLVSFPAGASWETMLGKTLADQYGVGGIGRHAQHRYVLFDGVNEMGLAGGALYFKGYADFPQPSKHSGQVQLSACLLYTSSSPTSPTMSPPALRPWPRSSVCPTERYRRGWMPFWGGTWWSGRGEATVCGRNRGTRVPLFASSRFIKKSEASLSQGGFLRFVRSVDH